MRWADTFRAEALKKEWINDEVTTRSRWHIPDGEGYDVIHFLYSGALTKSKEYILKHKDKVFTSLVSQRSLDGMFDNKKELFEIYKNTQCCVCQNPRLLIQLREFIPNVKAVYIPNGVDTELFNKPFVVGFVGAKDSNDHKGFHLAQEACDELGVELIKANEHDYTHEEMPEFYKKIDCLVIPSKSEGCHNPTLKALAMNVRVISTDVGIAKELQGVTIIERDVESLKKAIQSLNTRTQILEKYSWSNIANQYRKLYVEK
jgi:glycosyltransferase involved in cell wall biosynthesis